MQRRNRFFSLIVQFSLWLFLSHSLFPQLSLAAPLVSAPSATVNTISVGQSTPVVVQVQILTSAGDPALIAGSVNLL